MCGYTLFCAYDRKSPSVQMCVQTFESFSAHMTKSEYEQGSLCSNEGAKVLNNLQ